MKTNELEKSLYLISYGRNEDKEVISKLLDEKIDPLIEYFEPFKRELNLNLLSKDTFEAKRDLVKYYIFEFWELQGIFELNKEILFNGSLINYSSRKYEFINEKGRKRKLSESENYVVNCYFIFEIIFNEIQLCCVKYKIDFFELCDELHFSTELIEASATIYFTEYDSKSQNNTNILPQTNLTHLLRLYYQKGCTKLSQIQVKSLAKEHNNLSEIQLLKKWRDLDKWEYRHTGETLNVREFEKSYKILIEEFRGVNESASKNVENHYKQLKENYSNLLN